MGLRLGLLSTARINDAILGGAAKTDAVDVVAVGSRNGARGEEYARAKGLARAHPSYEALLADDDVDAVYISLPNSMHTEWSIRALEAGKHVLCEKPFDRRPEGVERAWDAADRAGRILMEAFMWRHHPQAKRLKQLVDEGAIGELRTVRTSFSFLMDDPANVRLLTDLDGGSLMDVGCYCVSGARLLCGEPELVSGQQVVGPSGVDVRFVGALRFAGDVLAHFDCAFDQTGSGGLEAVGTEGAALVRSPWQAQQPGIELRRGDDVERIEVEDVDRYTCQLENFAAAAAGEAEPLLGRDDALGQARTIEALYRSAETGAAVSL